MRDRSWLFFRCQSGAVVSAELVVIGTMVVVGLITGLTAVQNAINSELVDLSSAFNALDQSFGFVGYEAVSGNRRFAWTSSSSWQDVDAQAAGSSLQMRATEPRSEGRPGGDQPTRAGVRGGRGSGGAPGAPGAPPARGPARGGPDAGDASGDAETGSGDGDRAVLPEDALRAAGEWQTTQFAPAPYPGAQYPGAQPLAAPPGYAGPVYYTWQGPVQAWPGAIGGSPDSYYSPWFEGYRRYSLGGREMITHVRRQRISEWPLSPWPGQNGWLSSPEEYAAPAARFVPEHIPPAGADGWQPAAPPHLQPRAHVPQHGDARGADGPVTPPPPIPGGPSTAPPPVPDEQFHRVGPTLQSPPVPQRGAGAGPGRPHRSQSEIVQAAHSGAPIGRYQVPRQSRLYNAPSWYVAPPNAHQPRFPEYVW